MLLKLLKILTFAFINDIRLVFKHYTKANKKNICQYLHKKNELNYKKLGLRKGYLLISLKGDDANLVAQKVSIIKGITCVSLVTGNIDIMSACLFRKTADLFRIIENVKTIERVDKVSWAEEVRDIPSKEITILSSLVEESINTSVEENNTSSIHKETAP